MRNAFHPAVLAFVVSALPALADVSFNQHMKVEAAGAMSLLASEGDIVTLLSNDKSHTESTISMKSRLAGMFSGSGKTGSIVASKTTGSGGGCSGIDGRVGTRCDSER